MIHFPTGQQVGVDETINQVKAIENEQNPHWENNLWPNYSTGLL